MANLKLTDSQISDGASSLVNSKLSAPMIEDLISIFRGFLHELADNYEIESVLTALEDTATKRTCAKLSACITLMREEIEFDNGGFAPTLANKTGFNTSIDTMEFKIFKYAFGLLWNIPQEFSNAYLNGSRSRTSGNGVFINQYP